MSYYIGVSPGDVIGTLSKRYFYGLRRTDNGEVFHGKYDQLRAESLTINNSGESIDNYNNFEEGQDFFEGRDVNHNLVHANLNYEQLRWDERNISYYVLFFCIFDYVKPSTECVHSLIR